MTCTGHRQWAVRCRRAEPLAHAVALPRSRTAAGAVPGRLSAAPHTSLGAFCVPQAPGLQLEGGAVGCEEDRGWNGSMPHAPRAYGVGSAGPCALRGQVGGGTAAAATAHGRPTAARASGTGAVGLIRLFYVCFYYYFGCGFFYRNFFKDTKKNAFLRPKKGLESMQQGVYGLKFYFPAGPPSR